MGSAVAAAIALALAVPAAAAETAPPASSSGSASCRGPAPMVDFGSDGRIGARRNAATTTIAFGRPRKDGYYQALIADGEGGNERRVAFAAWRDDRHQFPAAWHQAGELMAMLVEHDEHERSSVDATPGYGAYTDYWIVTRDGGRAWKIYALPDGFDHAITHAAFSPDGSKFAVDRARQGAALLGLEPVRRQLSLQGRRLRPAPGRTSRTCARFSRATSTRAARSNRSPWTTGRSPSTAPTSRRTCSRRASTQWTSRAARSRS